MHTDQLKSLFDQVSQGKLTPDEALKQMANEGFDELGYAKIDTHRQKRTGYPEVIFCAGKSVEHVAGIVQKMLGHGTNILATRASAEMYEAVRAFCPEAVYHPHSRAIVVKREELPKTDSYIAIVTAGTSDIPVAEEAFITADIFGNRVEMVHDVGVAGIHRLYSRLELIRQAKVILVVAGMEGALPSIVAGLVDKPVLAVPTSVGYGANFFGLSALLGMLTSCASGIAVVNIDNGFGAGFMASMINRQ